MSMGYYGTKYDTAKGLRKLADAIENSEGVFQTWNVTKVFHSVKAPSRIGNMILNEPSGATTLIISNLSIPNYIVEDIQKLGT